MTSTMLALCLSTYKRENIKIIICLYKWSRASTSCLLELECAVFLVNSLPNPSRTIQVVVLFHSHFRWLKLYSLSHCSPRDCLRNLNIIFEGVCVSRDGFLVVEERSQSRRLSPLEFSFSLFQAAHP